MNTQDNSPSRTPDALEDTGAELSTDMSQEHLGDQTNSVQDASASTEDVSSKVVRREKVVTPQSFIDFVRYYGTIETIVFLDVKNGKAFSILNYAAKRVINDDDDEDDEDVSPAYYEAPPPSFHCNWQLCYELSHTPEWQQLDALTQKTYTAREGILKLLQLRDYFIEPDEEFDEALSFRDTEMRTFLPRVLDVEATPATDEEMVRLVLDKSVQQENLLINFALPVHAGCIAHEALILIESTKGKIKFDLINREQLMRASAKSGIAKIRTNLSDTFPVFDTDLDHFDG